MSFSATNNYRIQASARYDIDDVSIAKNSHITNSNPLGARVNYTGKRSDNLPGSGYSAMNPMYHLGFGYNNNSINEWKNEYFGGHFTKENIDAGRTVYRSGTPVNPYRTAYEELNKMDKSRVYGNMSATIDLAKGLKLKLRSALDMTHSWRTQQRPFYTADYEQGMYREQTTNIYHVNNDFLLTYINNNWLDKKLGFNVSFGGNSMNYRYYNNRITLQKLQIDGVYNIYNVPSGYSPDNFSYHSKKKVNSFYGVAHLSWDNTYYLEVTDRNDRSRT